MTAHTLAAALFCWAVLALPDPALAYVGPGVGLAVIGAVFALLSALFFGFLGFLWYPIKRLIALFRPRKADAPQGAEATDDPPDDGAQP